MRHALWIVLVIGCADPQPMFERTLSGSYGYAYTPLLGDSVSAERDDLVFRSPATAGNCCLGVWRRSDSTFELGVGNVLATPAEPVTGTCPPVAHARIFVTGVPDAVTPQVIDLASNAWVMTFYSIAPAEPCPQHLDPVTPVNEELALSGQLKLGSVHCADAPTDLGCALVASGSWAIRGEDATGATVLTTEGSFQASAEQM